MAHRRRKTDVCAESGGTIPPQCLGIFRSDLEGSVASWNDELAHAAIMSLLATPKANGHDSNV